MGGNGSGRYGGKPSIGGPVLTFLARNASRVAQARGKSLQKSIRLDCDERTVIGESAIHGWRTMPSAIHPDRTLAGHQQAYTVR